MRDSIQFYLSTTWKGLLLLLSCSNSTNMDDVCSGQDHYLEFLKKHFEAHLEYVENSVKRKPVFARRNTFFT